MKKEKSIRRLKIIKGQIEGLIQMMEGDTQCEKVIPQFKAVKNALRSLESEMIQEFFDTCLSDIPESKKDDIKQVIQTLSKL